MAKIYIRNGVHYGTAENMIESIGLLSRDLANAQAALTEIKRMAREGQDNPMTADRWLERIEERAAYDWRRHTTKTEDGYNG